MAAGKGKLTLVLLVALVLLLTVQVSSGFGWVCMGGMSEPASPLTRSSKQLGGGQGSRSPPFLCISINVTVTDCLTFFAPTGVRGAAGADGLAAVDPLPLFGRARSEPEPRQ